MSLYDTRSAPSSSPALSLGFRRFPAFVSLLVAFISVNTIINAGSYMASLVASNKGASFFFAPATSIVISCLLVAFCFGYIRRMWPPVLAALFAIIGIIKFSTAPAVTTDFKHLANFTYLKPNDLYSWFGTVSGTPYKILTLMNFRFQDAAIETQRAYHIFGVATTLFVCGLLIYLYWNRELRQGTQDQTL